MFKPVWNMRDVNRRIERFEASKKDQIVSAFHYAGEHYKNTAKERHTYGDRTGNLTSSIGYFIAVDGHIVEYGLDGNQEGKTAARKTANEVVSKYDEGVVLILVAGMEYALAVEARGYEVITSSAPGKLELEAYLRTLL